MDRIRTGLMSFGMSGQIFHAPFIDHNRRFELAVILERSKTRSRAAYPGAKIVTSVPEFLKQDLDLIIVNGPSGLHYEWTKAALQVCRAVVVEKPFVASEEEGEDLIRLAKEKGSILSVYHNKRYEGNIKTLAELLGRNSLGSIQKLVIRAMRYRPTLGSKQWKEDPLPGAGLLYDIGSHLIDQSLWLFGDPQDFSVQIEKQREGTKVDDYFKIVFKYVGFEVVMEAGFLQKEELPALEMHTTLGVYRKFGADPQEQQLKEDPIDWENLGKSASSQDGYWKSAEGREIKIQTARGTYGEFYEDLSQYIAGKGKNPVSPEEALKVITWIVKIKQKAGVV